MTKGELRERVWRRLEQEGVARFPGSWGRIPNFEGAGEAAHRLRELPPWEKARVVKANPDTPQGPARELALREGKTLYMAVPRLRAERCFVKLEPERLRGKERFAATIRGAFRLGRPVRLDEMEEVDLVLCGSVAVSPEGARVGKGGGYSDLEFALLVERGIITGDTPTVTTVHPLQVVASSIPMKVHDIPLDYIVTPEGVRRTESPYPKPRGIYPELLEAEKREAIPVLKKARK